MKMIKTEYRATLSGEHWVHSLRLAVGKYSADCDQNWSTKYNVTLQQYPYRQNNMSIRFE